MEKFPVDQITLGLSEARSRLRQLFDKLAGKERDELFGTQQTHSLCWPFRRQAGVQESSIGIILIGSESNLNLILADLRVEGASRHVEALSSTDYVPALQLKRLKDIVHFHFLDTEACNWSNPSELLMG